MRAGNKYGVGPAEKRTYEGILFHSIREMNAYIGFRALEKSGGIQKLERQVSYVLFAAQINPDDGTTLAIPVSKYIADFRVTELDGTVRIYESKGYATPEYKLKKQLFSACYRFLRIVEI